MRSRRKRAAKPPGGPNSVGAAPPSGERRAVVLPDDSRPPAYEFVVRVPRPLVSWTAHTAFCILLLYAALLTAPMGFRLAASGLDGSWQYALNVLPWSRYKFGTDVIFTYGPLGLIAVPLNVGWNLAIAMAVRVVVWALPFAYLGAAYGRSRAARLGCFLAVMAIVIGHPVVAEPEYMLTIGSLLLISGCDLEDRNIWSVAVPVGVLTSLAFLLKATVYGAVVLSSGAYCLMWYLRRKRSPSRRVWLALATMFGAPLAAYLVYNPSVRGLWGYLCGTVEVASGYNVAMSLPGLEPHYRAGLLLLAVLLTGFAVLAVWRRWLDMATAACVMAAFAVTLKHSMVRSDPSHLTISFALTPVLMGLLLLRCRMTSPAWVIGCLALALVGIVSVIGMDPVRRTLNLETWGPRSHLLRIRNVLDWRQSLAFLRVHAQSQVISDRLPDEIMTRISHAPVVIFPSELSFAAANDLDFLPLYCLQAYSGYTHELDQKTAEHLLADSPQDTRLLLQWDSVDERHPLLDMPATWEAIRTCFHLETQEGKLLLLRKQSRPQAYAARMLRSTFADVHQWQDVPDRDHALNASIRFRPNIQGRVRRVLYKVDPIYMEVEPLHGFRKHFRVIPEVLQHPFMLNCLPLEPAALAPLLSRDECTQKVRRFRFYGDGLNSFYTTAQVTLAEAPDEPLHFIPEKAEIWEPLQSPTNIAPAWFGNLELIDGHARPLPDVPSNPTRMRFGQNLEIHGWAASGCKEGESFETIYVIDRGRQLKAVRTARPDVAQYCHNGKLAESGFAVSIDAEHLDIGTHVFTFAGITHDHVYYRCPDIIYVNVE